MAWGVIPAVARVLLGWILLVFQSDKPRYQPTKRPEVGPDDVGQPPIHLVLCHASNKFPSKNLFNQLGIPGSIPDATEKVTRHAA